MTIHTRTLVLNIYPIGIKQSPWNILHKLFEKPNNNNGQRIANENSKDFLGESPNQRPATNVTPNRDIPGNKENPCITPIKKAFLKVRVLYVFLFVISKDIKQKKDNKKPIPTGKNDTLTTYLNNKNQINVARSATKARLIIFKIYGQQYRIFCNKKNHLSKKNTAKTTIVGPCKKWEIALLSAIEIIESKPKKGNPCSSKTRWPELLTGKLSKIICVKIKIKNKNTASSMYHENRLFCYVENSLIKSSLQK